MKKLCHYYAVNSNKTQKPNNISAQFQFNGWARKKMPKEYA